MMLANYLKVTVRNLMRHRIYTLVNISGLAVGFACVSLIILYVKNERSYDGFNRNAQRVYRVIGILEEAGLGEYHNAITQGPMGPALAAEMSQIESTVRILSFGSVYTKVGTAVFHEDQFRYADPGVFTMLDITLREGNPATALQQPLSVVLDRTTAQKYFGPKDPLGQSLLITGVNSSELYTVTGVMEDYPENSHTGFSMLGSFSSIEPGADFLKRWDTNTLTTYVLLRPGARKEEVEAQFPAFVDRHIPADAGVKNQYYLQPLLDIHLQSGHILYQSNRNQGSATIVAMISAIGLLVLLIASINYMNLATARSVKRAKEVGLRKVLGSSRIHLMYRFMGESTVTALSAFLFSLILAEVAYPLFKNMLGNRLVTDFHHTPGFLLVLFLICITVGVLSGLYPALVLSSYQPAGILRGTVTTGKKGAALRKGLVFVQFSIAVLLLVSTGVVNNQMVYIRSKDLGFDRNQLMYIPLRTAEARQRYGVMRDGLLDNAAVQSVTAGGGLAGASGSDGTVTVVGPAGTQRLMMRFTPVDYDFFTTLGIRIVQGRAFSRDIQTDSSEAVMVNEAALRELGWTDISGKELQRGDGPPLRIIGVVRDYHFFSLYTKIEPQMIFIGPDRFSTMLVKLRPHQIDDGVALAERIWDRQIPSQPFDYGFVDEAFERRYSDDQKTRQLFIGFSAIAIAVACLGLFGLSTFTAEQRTKEIGIRKVLGASVSSIVLQLSAEFVKLIALSCVVAFPLGYWIMQKWLQNFAYRADIGPTVFIAAGGLVVAIAIATISLQSFKSARANPVDSLRYE